MTKHRCCWLAVALLLVLARPQVARAVAVEYELAVRSPHVWRGITLREFPVLNASATARHKGFAVQLWAGIDLSDGNARAGEVQEIDLDASYTWDTDRASFTLGFVELWFPGGSIDSTVELFAKWQSKGLLAPRFEVYYNADLLRDVFALFSLSHRWQLSRHQLSRHWHPSANATLAYAGKEYARFFGGSQAGLHHWGLNLDLDYRPQRSGVKLRLGYSKSLNHDVLPDQPIDFWGGVYLAIRRP